MDGFFNGKKSPKKHKFVAEMNITSLILEFLKKNNQAVVSQFGTFSLKNSRAKIDAETNSILPPEKEIDFSVDYEVQNNELINYIAIEKNISADESSQMLKSETDFWKKTLVEKGELILENIGEFHQTENGIVLNGKRVTQSSPDFYGLEEIHLENLKNSSTTSVQDSDYKLNKSILWGFLFVIPVAGLVFLAFTQRELLFGKKSFNETKKRSAIHRIENDTAKVKSNIIDSTKTNTLQNDSIKSNIINTKISTK